MSDSPPPVLPVTSCPACLGKGIVEIASVPTIHPGSQLRVPLSECAACGHWFHSPAPTQETLYQLYSSGSEFVVPRSYGGTSQADPNALERNVSRFRRVFPDLSGLNYLEVGIGSGELYRHVAAMTAKAAGVEPGTWTGGAEGVVGGIEQIPEGFDADLLVMFDVLEHVAEPATMLADLRARASGKARLFLTVPNCESVAARLRKDRWRMMRPYGHLNYFSRRSLEHLCARTGWVVENLETIRIAEAPLAGDLVKAAGTMAKGKLREGAAGIAYATAFGGRDQWLLTARASG